MEIMLAEILKPLVNIEDISKIVYRKDDFGVTCFRHIDIECIYGDYLEIPESDRNYQKIKDLFQETNFEKEEVVLFERY